MPINYLIIIALIPITKCNIFGWGWDNSYPSVPHLPDIWKNTLQVTWPIYNNYMLTVSLLDTLSSLFMNNKQYFLRNMVKIAFEKTSIHVVHFERWDHCSCPIRFAPVPMTIKIEIHIYCELPFILNFTLSQPSIAIAPVIYCNQY